MELGFVGLGAMGLPMVQRLLAAKHSVVVFDLNRDAVATAVAQGAIAAASPLEVASLVETVFVSLPTPAIVRNVVTATGGLIDGTRIRHYIDLSTTGGQTAKDMAERLAARGIASLDAPVSGGTEGAKNGTLAIMISGEEALFESLRPVFEVIGKNLFHVGRDIGQAQTMKLINNLLAATAVAASSEALVMGAKAGLSAETMLNVINVSSGRNMATEKYFPAAVLTRRFDFGFKTELMYKDVRLCVEEAEALGVPMWIAGTVKQVWGFATSQNAGKEDMTAIIKFTEGWAGVEVKS
ncbi:NAD(P)-dependent oxidoreductase [Noviherbaspirillum sedimenti]|uniref:NAD(P)-dependent oxidoreductase n=1 Tax=Noviherbaspirillum sedimenti TaxID=2320865 RepID=A0A3A3FVE2_9BURK|nr:NAD(P)-dependent oxidoreductase [Noviherbaspirillum sedimenti]RJG00178.1 NAD(P)-dependent oxidoreductase [Noviherbaspirillum sedimenti]